MMLERLTIFVLLAILVQGSVLRINTETNQYIDDQGRERFFHGVNAVMKMNPYIPFVDAFDPCMSLQEKDFENMREWGLNSLRLGTMWPGVEPRQGYYNETYLEQLKWIVNTAGKYGIYTMLDMHQDLFSEKFCGDGIPLWLIPEEEYVHFPMPIPKKIEFDNETGLPIDCYIKTGWGTYYTAWDVAEGFEKLYTNYDGRLDKMAEFWGKVAQTFVGNPYVLGYELLNEPWSGNLYKNPLLMVPGVAERVHLQGVYDRVAEEIRKYDTEHIIFFEPVTWDNFVPVGFTHPPGGEIYANRSALAYHYYQPPAINMELDFAQRIRDIKRLNVGGFLSEFYISDGNASDIPKTMDMCDKYKQSWLGWIYKPYTGFCNPESAGDNGGIYHNNGTAVYSRVHNLARTYAIAVAGETIKTQFNTTTSEYVLSYKMCVKCGNTEINYNSEHYYPNGLTVTLSGNAKYQIISGQVIVSPNVLTKEHEIVTVTINAKQSQQTLDY